jgi:hypothetical protein
MSIRNNVSGEQSEASAYRHLDNVGSLTRFYVPPWLYFTLSSILKKNSIGFALSNEPNRAGVSLPPHLRVKRDPISKMLRSLEHWIMGKMQKPSNLKGHTPSSDPFRICIPSNPYILQLLMALS